MLAMQGMGNESLMRRLEARRLESLHLSINISQPRYSWKSKTQGDGSVWLTFAIAYSFSFIKGVGQRISGRCLGIEFEK